MNALHRSSAFTAAVMFATACADTAAQRTQESSAPAWQEDFALASRNLQPTGRSAFCVLEPGYQLVLSDGEDVLTITVLDETKVVDGVTTRVVEEREEADGELEEISRNFFAIDAATGDVFYFGEEVDIYEDGALVKHEGAWLAGRKGAKPGLLMPGSPVVGQRYYQELAPGEALDRAEVLDLAYCLKTPAATLEACLRTRETSALKPQEKDMKTYAPGIGLIQDEDLLLVRHGMLKAK
jgi:hypothetical protein